MEFMLIFAFSMVVIIPLVTILHSQYSQNKQDLDEVQVKQIIDELSIAIQNTYYSGYPSRTTLEFYIPRALERIEKVAAPNSVKHDLVFVLNRNNNEVEVVKTFPFGVNVSSLLNPQREGRYKILISAEAAGYVNLTQIT